MNWLAHSFISKPKIEYQLGNILADPLKGKGWEWASQDLLDGMSMHKFIDKFTDSHPAISESKNLLGESGRLKGVVLDVVFDHFLSRNWNEYSRVRFSDFLSQFHHQSEDFIVYLPKDARGFVSRLINSGRLGLYGSLEGVEDAFKKMELRFSARLRQKESLLEYIPKIKQSYKPLETQFHSFFPELMESFKSHELGSSADNFFK